MSIQSRHREAQLRDLADAHGVTGSYGGSEENPDRYAVLLLSTNDSEHAISTAPTFAEACEMGGDAIMDTEYQREPHLVRDLDTGEDIPVKVTGGPRVERADEAPATEAPPVSVGACWPMASDGDDSLAYVEKDDDLTGGPDGFDNDISAAMSVANAVDGRVLFANLTHHTQGNPDRVYPFVVTPAQLDALRPGWAPVADVYVVVKPEDVDGVYVFTDRDQAQTFAGRSDDAYMTTEVLIDQAHGVRFLADTADPEEETSRAYMGRFVRREDGQIFKVEDVSEDGEMIGETSGYFARIDDPTPPVLLDTPPEVMQRARDWLAHNLPTATAAADAQEWPALAIVRAVDERYSQNTPGQHGWPSFVEDALQEEANTERLGVPGWKCGNCGADLWSVHRDESDTRRCVDCGSEDIRRASSALDRQRPGALDSRA